MNIIIIIILWLCLITVSQVVCSTEITVDNNNGSSSLRCCELGDCICNSFYNALSHVHANTVINIISSNVSLDGGVTIQNKDNIAITSNVDATVLCNNVGLVVFTACNNVTIKGITWDQCGDVNSPNFPGIYFNTTTNTSIIDCTFQHFKTCLPIYISPVEGFINVANSKFMFNAISDASVCTSSIYSTLLVISSTSIDITVCNSSFHYNGISDEGSAIINGSLFITFDQYQLTQPVLIKNSSFISNGIRAAYFRNQDVRSKVTFDNIVVSDNRFGIYALLDGELDITSSYFTYNHNGALDTQIINNANIQLFNTTFANNYATSNAFGTALYVYIGNDSVVNISLCNFHDNIGGNSIVAIRMNLPFDFPYAFSDVLINSSTFKGNKNGSALQLTKCFVKFYSTTLFQDNSARSGAALYIAESSQISVDDGSTVQFINNTASLRGGAMYIDLTNCYDHGIVFTNFTTYDSIFFINNSAKLSGNSIYFDIPTSCDVIRDYTNNNSAAYVPYKLNYTQSHDIIGPAIAASPYEINLCFSAAKCDCRNSMNNSVYVITDDVMLGEFTHFNTMLCDYFNTAAEATMFQVNCIDCDFKYTLSDSELLIQDGLSNRVKLLAINAKQDLDKSTYISLNISSAFTPEYKQLFVEVSLTLSPCDNGYIFNKVSQQCECYSKDDLIQCEGDRASIRLGYWFGIFSEKHTYSICRSDYCDYFKFRKETREGFYNLPEEIDDQCNSHRIGVACGQCSEGYTLAYSSPDCISVEKCSSETLALVIVLTALYWIVIIAILFGVSYYINTQQILPGYLYGIIFYYSIVDILLVTNLHLTDAVFYTATILSSFAKLNPQFLGRLCFIENLDAIDQQFIHYCHVVFILIILIVIYIMAKCNNRALLYVNRGIVQVTCFVLLFSYTSLTSASLLLLRAMKFDDIDGLYTYLSPNLKYFANQHAAYASVALLCVLLVTIGFPLLLIMEPLLVKVINYYFNNDIGIVNFVKNQVCVARIKRLLDQLQDCYKDQHRWFAAYYLICRLVIMLITYYANDDYNYMIYYLQTACVVITMTHIWIQPYKNDLLNKLDTVILLVMTTVVNLSAFRFSISTTAGIAISLILIPFLLVIGVGINKSLALKIKRFMPNVDDVDRLTPPPEYV